jgi:hypothetical protein
VPWSNWFRLNAPEKPGSYRITLGDGSIFSVEEIDGEKAWVGKLYNIYMRLEKRLRENEPVRICKFHWENSGEGFVQIIMR